MKIQTYHVDAFSKTIFGGNPAAVCVLEKWLTEAMLQSIAAENHLPATAFLVRGNHYSTRWFTPEYEIDLCGHGSLSSGFVIFNYLEPEIKQVELHSPAGILKVSRQKELITLDFPVKSLESCPVSHILAEGLGATPNEVYQHKAERCLTVFDSEEQIKALKPDMQTLNQLGYRGIIVTAKGNESDFVTRVFYPKKLLSEDAVTGSSQCLLMPYWSNVLGKNVLHSRQLSHRSGDLFCEIKDERVFISGEGVLYMQGTITV